MICDEYAEEPSCQLQLDGMSDEGYELMREVRGWTREHLAEFCYFKDYGRRKTAQGQRPSPNTAVYLMRDKFKVRVPNGYARCLARIAMEEDASIDFNIKRSKVDGFYRGRGAGAPRGNQ